MDITYEPIPEGYRVFKGPFLLAILYTRHHQGAIKDASVVWEPLKPEDWNLHFTNPQMTCDDIKAIVGSLPKE